MPWVLEETFAAGGLDLHAEVRLRRLDPLYRIRWAGERRGFDFHADRERLREQIARFDRADAARVDGFLDALKPIYEQGILGAGPAARSATSLVRGAAAADGAARRDPAAAPVRRTVLPPPARARGVLVPLAVHRRRPVPRARDLRRAGLPAGARRRLVRRRRRLLAGGGDGAPAGRALRRAGGGDRARPRRRAGGLAGGRRARSRPTSSSPTPTCCARTSCSARARRCGGCGRRCPASCSTSAPTAVQPSLLHHTLLVGPGYREFIRTVTRGRALP